MAAIYRQPRVTRPRQSVCIATAAYQSVKAGYAHSLALTTSELTARGIPFELIVMHDNCHVDDGRNSICAAFLNETQCTDLIFIDADLRWQAKEFLRLISHDTTDIIAGAYPFKSFPKRYPVGKILNDDPNDPQFKEGIFQVSYVPTGFMRIPRNVLETLRPKQSRRGSETGGVWGFFERRYTEKTYDGGDVTFCRKWIAAGGKVLVDSNLTLEHIGEHRWAGNFLEWLGQGENRKLHTVDHKDPIPTFKYDHPQTRLEKKTPQATPTNPPPTQGDAWAAIHLLAQGKEINLTGFQAIADAWGNKPWAATPEYLDLAYRMAIKLSPGETILECGSGVSTVILALAAKAKNLKLVTLEHTNEWQEKVKAWLDYFDLTVDFPSPNISRDRGWYDYDLDFTPDLMILDGPPRYLGTDRLYPLKQGGCEGSAVLLDDASKNVLEQLQDISGEFAPVVLGGRPAAVGRMKIDNYLSVA